MKTIVKLAAVTLVAVTALTGCALTPQPSEKPATDKDASMKGSRICFINSSDVPMSATITGVVLPENANTLVGKTGVLGSSELCFAGWNGINTTSLYPNKDPYGRGETNTTDVAVGVNIDGNYDQIRFRAFNGFLYPPFMWWFVPGVKLGDEGGGIFKENVSKTGTVDTHEFTVIRRNDSDNYKEFLVQFTK